MTGCLYPPLVSPTSVILANPLLVNIAQSRHLAILTHQLRPVLVGFNDMLALILATVVVLLVLLLFAYVLWNLTIDYRKLDCSYERFPGFVWLMCRALWQAALKRQGEASHDEWRKALKGAADSGSKEQVMGKHEQLRELHKLLRMDWLALSVPPSWLAAYNSVCCCTAKNSPSSTKVVPACFPETLFFKQKVFLATSSAFPVSPLGLIHVKEVVRVFEPLVQILEEPVDLRTEVTRSEMVQKGIEIDFTSRVFLRGRDICVWEGVSTVLSRNAVTMKRQTKARPTKPSASSGVATVAGKPSGWMTVHVPASIGLQYARVTGDYNPHHLYPWTARLVGYSNAMAHGMWTLQRALQCVKETCPGELQHLPLVIKTTFRRPLYIPSSVKVSFCRSGPALQLRVTNARDESDLHVEATVQRMT